LTSIRIRFHTELQKTNIYCKLKLENTGSCSLYFGSGFRIQICKSLNPDPQPCFQNLILLFCKSFF
jgi:hypothetical protein